MESPTFAAEANGPATVETYTVVFDREGEPELGIVIGRLADGTRFIANTPAGRRAALVDDEGGVRWPRAGVAPSMRCVA